MATSRTGTSKYLRARATVLRQAKATGLTHCPGYERRDGSHRNCGRELDYDTPQTDASAEADHILDAQYGGTDDAENLRVICRACNRERNNDKITITVPPADAFPLDAAWLDLVAPAR